MEGAQWQVSAERGPGRGGQHGPGEQPLPSWVSTEGEGDPFNICSDSLYSPSRSFLVSKGRGLSFRTHFKMYIFI